MSIYKRRKKFKNAGKSHLQSMVNRVPTPAAFSSTYYNTVQYCTSTAQCNPTQHNTTPYNTFL